MVSTTFPIEMFFCIVLQAGDILRLDFAKVNRARGCLEMNPEGRIVVAGKSERTFLHSNPVFLQWPEFRRS